MISQVDSKGIFLKYINSSLEKYIIPVTNSGCALFLCEISGLLAHHTNRRPHCHASDVEQRIKCIWGKGVWYASMLSG